MKASVVEDDFVTNPLTPNANLTPLWYIIGSDHTSPFAACMFANIDPVAVTNMKVGPAMPVITLYDAETVIVLVAGLIVFT